MAQIFIRPLAQNDLLDIWNYRSQFSEGKANSLIIQFDQKFQLLADNKHMGRKRTEFSFKKIRSFPLEQYVIFYIPTSKGIEVIRILHAKRDINQLIP